MSSGTVNVQSGGVALNGSLDEGAVLTGPGFTQLFCSIRGEVTEAGFGIVNSGTIASLSGPGTLDVTGSLEVDAGTIMNGQINVLPSGKINVGYSQAELGATLNNSGTMTFNSSLGIGIGLQKGSLNNQTGGVIEVLSTPSGASPFVNANGTTNLVRNDGLLDFDTGTSTTLSCPPLINNATISCSTGSLLFGAGTFSYGGGAILTGPGTIDLGVASTTYQVLLGTLTLAGSNIKMSNGSIAGSGDLVLATSLTWNGGTIGGTGLMTVPTSASVNIGTSSNATLSRTLNNAGTIAGAGTLRIYGGLLNNSGTLGTQTISLNAGTVTNLAGGVINLMQNSSAFTLGAGTLNVVTNLGVINATSVFGGSITLDNGITFINSGTINVPSGTLHLQGGTSTFTCNGGTITGAGTIDLSGTPAFNNIVTLAGANMRFSNGNTQGSGTVNVTGTLNWSGGTLGGSGVLNIKNGATLAMTSSATLAQTLDNHGTVTLNSSTIFLSNGTLTNEVGGVINLVGSSGLNSGVLVNSGLINVNAPGTTVTVSAALVDSGTINALQRDHLF